jgi:hypothetical protein
MEVFEKRGEVKARSSCLNLTANNFPSALHVWRNKKCAGLAHSAKLRASRTAKIILHPSQQPPSAPQAFAKRTASMSAACRMSRQIVMCDKLHYARPAPRRIINPADWRSSPYARRRRQTSGAALACRAVPPKVVAQPKCGDPRSTLKSARALSPSDAMAV